MIQTVPQTTSCVKGKKEGAEHCTACCHFLHVSEAGTDWDSPRRGPHGASNSAVLCDPGQELEGTSYSLVTLGALHTLPGLKYSLP